VTPTRALHLAIVLAAGACAAARPTPRVNPAATPASPDSATATAAGSDIAGSGSARRSGSVSGPASGSASTPTPTGRVTVDLLDVQTARGHLRVALFRSARGFPDRAGGAFARVVRRARAGTVRVTFEAVPPGPFAVTVHHDADADRAMDTGLFGMPQEGYGFSRDASAPFGPPDFAASRLVLAAGQHRRVRIHLRY
jgi:uncharacterized protein (DUF2141 family)